MHLLFNRFVVGMSSGLVLAFLGSLFVGERTEDGAVSGGAGASADGARPDRAPLQESARGDRESSSGDSVAPELGGRLEDRLDGNRESYGVNAGLYVMDQGFAEFLGLGPSERLGLQRKLNAIALPYHEEAGESLVPVGQHEEDGHLVYQFLLSASAEDEAAYRARVKEAAAVYLDDHRAELVARHVGVGLNQMLGVQGDDLLKFSVLKPLEDDGSTRSSHPLRMSHYLRMRYDAVDPVTHEATRRRGDVDWFFHQRVGHRFSIPIPSE